MPAWIILGAIGALVLYELKGAVSETNALASTVVTGAVVLGGLYIVAKAAKVA